MGFISKGLTRLLLGFGALLLLAGLSGGEGEPAQPRSPETSAAPAPSTASPLPSGTPELVSNPSGEVVTVLRVIDGDTFELSDHRRVRVLGINSCEMGTPGGQAAKEWAEAVLTSPASQPITLGTEPGVTTDRYGRLLRYVGLAGVDYGERIVVAEHTGVYAGRNAASPGYVERLRRLDPNGRTCGDVVPPTTEPPAAKDHYVPLPRGGGDDDHHHESRFCRRRWWC